MANNTTSKHFTCLPLTPGPPTEAATHPLATPDSQWTLGMVNIGPVQLGDAPDGHRGGDGPAAHLNAVGAAEGGGALGIDALELHLDLHHDGARKVLRVRQHLLRDLGDAWRRVRCGCGGDVDDKGGVLEGLVVVCSMAAVAAVALGIKAVMLVGPVYTLITAGLLIMGRPHLMPGT